MENIIDMQNICFGYWDINILNHFSLSIEEWDVVSILWPSWIWKSTLVKLIAGYQQLSSWEIYIQGHPHRFPSREVIMVSQENDLFDWLTVEGNLEIVSDKVSQKEIDLYLRMANLHDCKNCYPSQLSGWMKKRLSIIRGLLIKPKIIILDEAFWSLDIKTKESILADFSNIIWGCKITALLVTHDIDEALKLSDRIVILKDCPIKIIKDIRKWEDSFNEKYITKAVGGSLCQWEAFV